MRIPLAARRFGNVFMAAVLAVGGWTWGMAADPVPAKIVVDGPALLRQWAPAAFPKELEKEKIEVRLVVRTIIDATGKVTAARVLDPEDARFNDAALAAVKSWGFAPAIVDGQPAACCLDVPVEFSSAKARKKGKPESAPGSLRFMPEPAPRTASAEPLDSPAGDYPAVLTERKLPGIVRFTCVVSPEGRALNPQIVAASHVDFVLPALEALKKWTFSPAMEGDLKVKADLEGQMTFDLIGVPSRSDALAANGLTAPDGTPPPDSPQLVAMADPVWPLDALLAGEGGSATVEFTVGIQGQVTNVKVSEASQPAFGQALLAAAETWQFEPAIKDGMGIDVILRKKMTFTAVPKAIPEGADALTQLVADLRVDGRIGTARGLDARLEPVYRVAPVYPAALRANDRPAGQAMIDLVIDREGRAQLPKVVSTSQAEFGWAAATAAAQWVFKPATRGGQPTAVRVRIPFTFTAPAE